MNKNKLLELLEQFYETQKCKDILACCLNDLGKNKSREYDEEAILEAIAESFEWAVERIIAQGELLKVTDATGQSDDDEPSLAQKIEWAADARMYLGGK